MLLPAAEACSAAATAAARADAVAISSVERPLLLANSAAAAAAVAAVLAMSVSSDTMLDAARPAAEGAVLWVNGNALSTKDKVKLEHGARVILGHDFVFRPGF